MVQDPSKTTLRLIFESLEHCARHLNEHSIDPLKRAETLRHMHELLNDADKLIAEPSPQANN